MATEIAVIGAGIIGLSSALAIQRKCPGVKVTIIADKFDRHTTSDGAGGIFLPLARGIDDKIYDLWSREGANHFYDLAFSSESGASGVQFVSGYDLLLSEHGTRPFFKYMLHVAKMSSDLMKRFPSHYKSGHIVTTTIVDGSRYLPWLMNRFLKNGGKVIDKKIQSFEELVGKYNIVVNCAGLGSKELTQDPDLQPARGHIVRISAPWIKHFIHGEDYRYIIPSTDTVAIGGVYQPGRSDLVPLATEGREIWNSVREMFPIVEGAKVLWEWVGLRPHRDKVRLEAEVINLKGTPLKVIHNYGHGSFGISLSWGTGVHVSQIVESMLPSKARL